MPINDVITRIEIYVPSSHCSMKITTKNLSHSKTYGLIFRWHLFFHSSTTHLQSSLQQKVMLHRYLSQYFDRIAHMNWKVLSYIWIVCGLDCFQNDVVLFGMFMYNARLYTTEALAVLIWLLRPYCWMSI